MISPAIAKCAKLAGNSNDAIRILLGFVLVGFVFVVALLVGFRVDFEVRFIAETIRAQSGVIWFRSANFASLAYLLCSCPPP